MKGGPGNRPSSVSAANGICDLHLSRRISHTSVVASGLAVGGDVEQALESVGVPSYVLDEKGFVRWINPAAERLLGDIRGRHYTSVVAPEETSRARDLVSKKLLGTTQATEATGFLVSTAGTRVAVELSSVPLMNGERVVGVFGLIEERPDESSTAPPPHTHPPPGRGASSSGAGPLDEADRCRTPPEPRDGQEPHPPSLSGPRRQLPTRSRRRRTRSIRVSAVGTSIRRRELTRLCPVRPGGPHLP